MSGYKPPSRSELEADGVVCYLPTDICNILRVTASNIDSDKSFNLALANLKECKLPCKGLLKNFNDQFYLKGISMLLTALFATTLFLAYSNGANDNFKGVATLFGSGTIGYRTAITLATLTTFAGSLSALFLAQGLIGSFSGKGLVPQETTSNIVFLISVGAGAGCTVLLATRLGFPISTTHSLIGGLLGAGLVAAGNDVNILRLFEVFLIPLLVSPIIALVLGMLVYWVLTQARQTFGLSKESCFCIGKRWQYVPVALVTNEYSANNVTLLSETVANGHTIDVSIADYPECREFYTSQVWGVHLQTLLNIAHCISGSLVCFARGLNDTPKIAGLLVAVQVLDLRWGMLAIAVAMGIGGLLNARRVAETLSHGITELNHGQGFAANLVTSFLVIFASKLGVPVSTTHVSVGSIFGIGIITGQGNGKMIRNILLSWIITLPTAIVLSAVICALAIAVTP